MWVYFDGGFVSIVQKKGEVMLQVRGRRLRDVEEFVRAAGFGDKSSVLRTDDADYRYRAFLNRKAVAVALTMLIDRLDYDNFKSRVLANAGPARAHVYGEVWRETLELEHVGEGPTERLRRVAKTRGRAKVVRSKA